MVRTQARKRGLQESWHGLQLESGISKLPRTSGAVTAWLLLHVPTAPREKSSFPTLTKQVSETVSRTLRLQTPVRIKIMCVQGT